ncbi:MAG TPA: hypothetical protein VES20_14180, partial [Bryobacteraceae bacterium]|nr:hypothetical protein [Bryobacteraceae bacterium]
MAQQRCGRLVGATFRLMGVALAFTGLACAGTTEELCRQESITGRYGGWLQTAQRAEPTTF